MLAWRRSGRLLLKKQRLILCPIDTDDEGNNLYHCPCCLAYAIVTKCQQNGTLPPAYKPFDNLWIVCYSSTIGMIYWEDQQEWYELGKYYDSPIDGIFQIVDLSKISSEDDEGGSYNPYPRLYRTRKYAKKTLDAVNVEKLKEQMESACKCTPQVIATGVSYTDNDGNKVKWFIPQEVLDRRYNAHRWKIVETSYGNYPHQKGNISSKGQIIGLRNGIELPNKGYTSYWALVIGCLYKEGGQDYIDWPPGYEDQQSPPKKD